MSASRTPAPAVVAILLTVAVSLLGVRLFLPGPAACRSACCCGVEGRAAPAPAPSPCGCSVSPATPLPAALLASIDTVAPPALAAERAEGAVVGTGAGTAARTPTEPRARSAPTQAFLETFRI